jgi:nitrate reductase gamma subunit
MMLAGCVLALWWRYTVRGTPERRFADTPMVLALLFVVASGFVVEGWRLAQEPAAAHHAYSALGLVFAWAIQAAGLHGSGWLQPLWLTHVLASCALIGWIPATRLIHTCATPFGRLLLSQKGLLAAKKQAVLRGLLRPQPRP